MKQRASGLLVKSSEITLESLLSMVKSLEKECNGLKETIANNYMYTVEQLAERDATIEANKKYMDEQFADKDAKIEELTEGYDALYNVLKNHSDAIKSYLGE